jgi:hypothetical protein
LEIILGIRGILRLGLAFLLIGLAVGNFAKDHWTELMLYTPFWVIPIWGYMIPVILVSVWLLFFTGGHHD